MTIYKSGTLPDPLVPYLKRRVSKAWRSSDRLMLFIVFEDQSVFNMEVVQLASGEFAMKFDTGSVKEGFDFDWLEVKDQRSREIVGRRFTGFDGSVVMFGSVGAMVTPEGFVWVRDGQAAN